MVDSLPGMRMRRQCIRRGAPNLAYASTAEPVRDQPPKSGLMYGNYSTKVVNLLNPAKPINLR